MQLPSVVLDSGIHARMTGLKIVASDKGYLLEIINTFTVSTEKEIMLFNYALVLYRKNKLGLGKAAELAGSDRLTFFQKLQPENEPIHDYEADLVNEMLDNSQQTLALLKMQQ